MNERTLVYAITRARGVPVVLDVAGVRGAPVRRLNAGTLAAWASTTAPVEATAADLLAFHAVVEGACAAGDALPVRFGTWLASEDELRAAVRAREAFLSAALKRVVGKRELALTLAWVETRETHGTASAGEAIEARPGTRYLQARRRAWIEDERRRERAERLAAELSRVIGVHGDQIRQRICPLPLLALSCAVLVDDLDVDAVRRRVVEAGRAWPDVQLRVAGPWPPYTFSGPGVLPATTDDTTDDTTDERVLVPG